MADIILTDRFMYPFPEPRSAIKNDLIAAVNGMLDEPTDARILNMPVSTRKLWINILERIEKDNPNEAATIQRLRKRFEDNV